LEKDLILDGMDGEQFPRRDENKKIEGTSMGPGDATIAKERRSRGKNTQFQKEDGE